MPEVQFDDLDVGAQEEIRKLATEFNWSLEYTARRYVEAGESLAVQRQFELMRRPSSVLSLATTKRPSQGAN